MEKTLHMIIEPKAKERPRGRISKTKGGKPFVQMYTPKNTAEYEKKIRDAWIKEYGDAPSTGPVDVKILLGMRIPKGTSKVRREPMLHDMVRPVVKPDVDNCAKAVLDALNGVAYVDDNHVVSLTVRKKFAEVGNIIVRVRDWEPKGGDNHERMENTDADEG